MQLVACIGREDTLVVDEAPVGAEVEDGACATKSQLDPIRSKVRLAIPAIDLGSRKPAARDWDHFAGAMRSKTDIDGGEEGDIAAVQKLESGRLWFGGLRLNKT